MLLFVSEVGWNTGSVFISPTSVPASVKMAELSSYSRHGVDCKAKYISSLAQYRKEKSLPLKNRTNNNNERLKKVPGARSMQC